MKKKMLRLGKGFKVLIGNPRVQAAQTVIAPGGSEGGPNNRHRGADQWLLVISGSGTATVNGRRHALRRHSLLLIEHGEEHQIRNTGRRYLKTINFYSPPAYTKAGDPRLAGKP